MKKNYEAWKINDQEFSHDWNNKQKLLFFVNYAVLAPSGHNTQPWIFTYKNDALYLQKNPNTELPFSGQLAAEPFISLGSCYETLRQAARGFGYNLSANYLFEEVDVVAVQIHTKILPLPKLLEAIKNRTSNRHPFEQTAVSQSIINECTENHLDLAFTTIVSDRKDISFLAEQTKQATQTIMRDKGFRTELSHWVRNNVTNQYDGMPGFTQGMPTPPSMVARHVVKHIDISTSQAKKDAQRIQQTGSILILVAKDTSSQAFFEVGRMYAYASIRAQLHGYATSGVGAAVIDPLVKSKIANHFGIAHIPCALMRIGKPSKHARHTPRRPAEQVIV